MNVKAKLAAMVAAVALATPLVMKWEGLRVSSYQDHIGVWTICYGHTGPDVGPGLKASGAQCQRWLEQDLAEAYDVTMACVPGEVPRSVRAAFTSFAFNVGPGRTGVKDGMCRLKSGRIPSHVVLLNTGQYAAACDRLLLWANAGGAPSKGVMNRRLDEVSTCKKDLP